MKLAISGKGKKRLKTMKQVQDQKHLSTHTESQIDEIIARFMMPRGVQNQEKENTTKRGLISRKISGRSNQMKVNIY